MEQYTEQALALHDAICELDKQYPPKSGLVSYSYDTTTNRTYAVSEAHQRHRMKDAALKGNWMLAVDYSYQSGIPYDVLKAVAALIYG